MITTIVDVPSQERKRSKHYNLVTQILEAYRVGKAVLVEMLDGEVFSPSGVQEHLRVRMNGLDPRDRPGEYLFTKKIRPRTWAVWVLKPGEGKERN